MNIIPPPARRAFTVMEALVLTAVIVVLLMAFLPRLAESNHHASRINCVNNLKQIGLAVRIWYGDKGDKYPMNLPVAQGGAQELLAAGNVTACFQVMSNELATPKILICPVDKRHTPATNFDAPLTRNNVSYFLALNASESDPQAILSGDDNLIQNGRTLPPGLVNLATNQTTWTTARHSGGNILLGDGSVQTLPTNGIMSSPGTFFSTNRIMIP